MIEKARRNKYDTTDIYCLTVTITGPRYSVLFHNYIERFDELTALINDSIRTYGIPATFADRGFDILLEAEKDGKTPKEIAELTRHGVRRPIDKL